MNGSVSFYNYMDPEEEEGVGSTLLTVNEAAVCGGTYDQYSCTSQG